MKKLLFISLLFGIILNSFSQVINLSPDSTLHDLHILPPTSDTSIYYAEFGIDVGQTMWTITGVERDADTLWIEANDTALYRIIGDSSLAFTDRPLITSPSPLVAAPYGLSISDEDTKIQSIAKSADSMIFNVGGWKFKIEAEAEGGFSAQYQAVYDEFNVVPGADTAAFQDTLVRTLVDSGYWSRIDVVYVFAQNYEDNALLNWKAPTGDDNCTNVGAVSFAQYQGFDGNGSNNYLNTNFNANTEGVNFTLDDGSIAVYIRTSASNGGVALSSVNGSDRISLQPRAANQSYHRINAASSYSVASASDDGFWMTTRRGNTDNEAYKNGASITTSAIVSSSVPDDEIDIFRLSSGSNYYADEIAIVIIMDGVSDAEAAEINTIVEKYMDDIGMGVQ